MKIPEVDNYIEQLSNWRDEINTLRQIALSCGLVETYKWRVPCYVFNNVNVFILGGFKNYCSITFFKGALLQDTMQILVRPGENSQSARYLKFNSLDEITAQEGLIRAYIFEAIEIEKSGLKITKLKPEDTETPEEFSKALNDDIKLKNAFEALTPGRQRAYLMHFNGSKQAKTREARIEKYKARILSGKGINDCTCGLSKRMPTCDGSHKNL